MSTTRQAATIMRRREEPLILRLLWQAVFGKEDLLVACKMRLPYKPNRNLVTRSKA